MSEPLWEGVERRECGEHRTVGSHRAWCFDCTEWCYSRTPEMHCRGCELPGLRARLDAVEALCTRTIDGEQRSHVPVRDVLAVVRGER